MPNYAWNPLHPPGEVYETDHPVDGKAVFATFAAARSDLAKWYDEVAVDYRRYAKEVRAFRKRDVRKAEN